MNYSDSERVSAALQDLGYKRAQSDADADLYIFNTCSIRQKGEDRVYGKLADLALQKCKNPHLLVGLTGCMVRRTSTKNSVREAKDKLVRDLKSVDFVFRIEDAKKLGKILEDAAKPKVNKTRKSLPGFDSRLDYLDIKPVYTSPFQALVPVQIGCDKYCTYCIVPYARGREQSRPLKDVVAECRALVASGCKEITLVGQTVNSYGRSEMDKKSGLFNFTKEPFVALLAEIDQLRADGLNRLRFTSPHPYDYSDALIQAHKTLQTLTPHFHIPIQAGSDETLKRMNRRYTAADYKRLIQKIRKTLPGASVTTDIIVGFSGETRNDFTKTLKLFKEIKWDMAYLARYSPRPGTISHKYFKDDVPRTEKARRWHALNKVLTKCSRDYNKKLVGRTLEVLVEKYDKAFQECQGRSRENKTVQFHGQPKMVGTLQNVKILKALEWNVKGEFILNN